MIRPRLWFYVLALAAVFLISQLANAQPREPAPELPGEVSWPKPLVVVASEYRHRTAEQWYRAFRYEQRRVARLVTHHPTVTEAIQLAAAVYGNGSTLWRKARCESHLWPFAHNSSGASGLFQFLPGTWRSTPFGDFSIWSPYANALAAGWMHRAGRGGEWSCR